jgi:hypothetical protein
MDEEGFDEEEKKGNCFLKNRIKYNGKKERKKERKTHPQEDLAKYDHNY